MCDSVNISFLRLNDIMDHSLIDKQYTNTLTELLKATDGYFVWLTITINHLSRGTHALSRVSTFSGWQPRQRSLDLQSHWLTTRSSLPYPSEVRSPPASPYSLNPPESSCCRPLPHAFARLVKQKHGLGGSEIWPRIMLPFQPTGTTRDSAALLLFKSQPREWALLCFIRQGWAYVGQQRVYNSLQTKDCCEVIFTNKKGEYASLRCPLSGLQCAMLCVFEHALFLTALCVI